MTDWNRFRETQTLRDSGNPTEALVALKGTPPMPKTGVQSSCTWLSVIAIFLVSMKPPKQPQRQYDYCPKGVQIDPTWSFLSHACTRATANSSWQLRSSGHSSRSTRIC